MLRLKVVPSVTILLNRQYYHGRPDVPTEAYEMCTNLEGPRNPRFVRLDREYSGDYNLNAPMPVRLVEKVNPALTEDTYVVYASAQLLPTATFERAMIHTNLLKPSCLYHGRTVVEDSDRVVIHRDGPQHLMNTIVWRDESFIHGAEGLLASAFHAGRRLLALDSGDDSMADASELFLSDLDQPVIIQPGVVACRAKHIMSPLDLNNPEQKLVLLDERHVLALLLCKQPREVNIKGIFSWCWSPSMEPNGGGRRVFLIHHRTYVDLMRLARRIARHVGEHPVRLGQVLVNPLKIEGGKASDNKVPMMVTLMALRIQHCENLLFEADSAMYMLPKNTECKQWICTHDRLNPDHNIFVREMQANDGDTLHFQEVMSHALLAKNKAAPLTEVATEDIEQLAIRHYTLKKDAQDVEKAVTEAIAPTIIAPPPKV
jgi:hypothetical protein